MRAPPPRNVDEEEVERKLRAAFRIEDLLKVAEEAPDDEGETLTEEEKPPSSPIPTVSGSGIFQQQDAHPYVLDLILLKKYGPEWLEWETETLLERVAVDWRSFVSELNLQKLQAVKTLHFVDTFWQNWEVFVPCTMSFNNTLPDFEMMQVPTVAQCAVAIDTANRLRSEVKWSEEMKAYLEVVHRFNGILCPAEPMNFITIDTEDVAIDCGAVMRQWPEVRKSLQAPNSKTAEAEQLRRLLGVHEALIESRALLVSQLGNLNA